VEGSDGKLYGTCWFGGTTDGGTVFKLNRDGSGYAILRSFTGCSYPCAGLLEGSDGALYDTTSEGGSWNWGTVFKLNKGGSGYAILRSFQYLNDDGYGPVASVVEGGDGALYGTGQFGGSAGNGTVFKLNKDGGGYTVLYSFLFSDGSLPSSAVVEWGDGTLYGTTSGDGSTYDGTVFKLKKDGSGYAVLHSFTGTGSDGARSYAGLAVGSDGGLYGTTSEGGNWNYGTVFRMTGLGRPRLRLQLTQTNTDILSWPSPATGFALEENNILATTNWTNTSQVPFNDGTMKSVTVRVSSGAKFYRLKAP
jgi:uncharacterized repeat protein (TIGR03803 family)